MASKPKPNEFIKLTFLAMVRDFPERITLKEHSLDFSDAGPTGSLISGVYGAHSKHAALVLAANWTKEHVGRRIGPTQILHVDAVYRAELLIDRSDQMRAGVTGWLHFDRMSADLRDNVKNLWLSWIEAGHGKVNAARLADSSLGDIALEYPGYISKMMGLRAPRLTAIVHPVRPKLEPGSVLWVASVRYEKDRFIGPLVRFLPQIHVDL